MIEGLSMALKETVQDESSFTDFTPSFDKELQSDVMSFEDADRPFNYANDTNDVYEENVSRYDTDDNGKTYKENGELLANDTYEINEYRYVTDDKARIISVEGDLHLSNTERKTINEDNVGGEDKRETDDRGHLIADRFNGSNKIENLVPMDANLNRGDFKKNENLLADALSDGREVTLKVEPTYEGDSKRPTSFTVTDSIDGAQKVVVFANERKGV
ncbi:DNA/RNA non-specific endonuclease [Clostridium vincentii]|uniref:Putative ribonuclease YeeF n=1 Tax=Clostridium vincentii TaxID=52704 RepID=A0A2T0BDV6_9CLOT|nr:DNA/RNA non-specific endonuclease [Clostridium vincentii]PRR82002.1 putative ribonuclease YeeF [Clostridium vincentii]